MPELKIETSIHNRFDIEVRDAKTGKLKQKAEAYNVICDGLWDTLLAHDANNNWQSGNIGYNQRIVFGTGIGTPSSSDASLFNYLGYKDGTFALDGTHFLENLLIANRTIVLNPDEYVGSDLTEVGIGTSSVLATHALIKDLNGNIISIHKTDTDIITIISSIYIHFNKYLNKSIIFDYDLIIDPDTSEFRIDNYQHPNIFLCGISGYSGIVGSTLSSVSSRVNGAASNNDSDFCILNAAHSSMIVDYSNKKITINYNRLQADVANNHIHKVYRISFDHNDWATRIQQPTLLLFTKNWYTPALITQESIGTGDGTTTGFNTRFPIKTVDKVYIDGIQEMNYSYIIGLTKPCSILRYMPRVKKKGNVLYYVTSSYESVDANDCISCDFFSFLSETLVHENPFHLSFGIKELEITLPVNGSHLPSSGIIKLFGSDDFDTWVESSDITGYGGQTTTFSLPSELKNKKYYKIKAISWVGGDWGRLIVFCKLTSDFPDSEHNILFSTPPAVGSVITIDYTPDCVAKDENHVFDLSLSISFNESQVV